MRIDSLRPCVNGVEHDESGEYPHDPEGNCRECVFEGDQKQHQRVQELVELMRKSDRRTNEKYGSIHWFYAVAEHMLDRLPAPLPVVTSEQVDRATRALGLSTGKGGLWEPLIVELRGQEWVDQEMGYLRDQVVLVASFLGFEVEQ